MSFEALSYTWGKPDGPQSPVIINGFELLVSQNLFDALIHLRNDSEHRMLWIDAICINQMDWSEKTHQVQLMARIYSGAHRVLVWLGPEENDSSFVMESLQKVSRGDIDLDHEVFRSDKLLRCLKAIMERRWWSRIWVIQEVAMAANDPLLYCGFSSVSWTLLLSALIQHGPNSVQALLSESPQKADQILNNLTSWSTFSMIRDIRRRAGNHPSYFLQASFGHQATEPRDMIFALYGFFDSTHRSILIPDYSLPIEFVFTLVTTVVIIFDQDMKVFDKLSIAQNTSLPSWVPDFACQKQGSPYAPWYFVDTDTQEEKVSSASGNLSPIVIALQLGQLGIDGFHFDTVVNVYDFGNVEDDTFSFIERIHRLEEIAKEAQ
jgi:hypothetical protein